MTTAHCDYPDHHRDNMKDLPKVEYCEECGSVLIGKEVERCSDCRWYGYWEVHSRVPFVPLDDDDTVYSYYDRVNRYELA